MRVGKARPHSGFTLIELLATLAVMIIVSTIAVPGFQNLISSSRVTSDYNEILTGFNYARSEAVKRRDPVSASLVADESGKWKMIVKVVNGDALAIRESGAGQTATGSLSVTFNALGRRAGCSSVDCTVNVATKAIQINPMGQVGKPAEQGGGV